MTARSAAHALIGAICNFSLTYASPACPWQGAPPHRRTQELVDSHDTLIAPERGRGHLEARVRGERSPAERGAPVLERYLLRERLGAGGFGVVWRAHDVLLDREVAVKVIPLPAGEDRERAMREALATARLAHPAIVALYEACAERGHLLSDLRAGPRRDPGSADRRRGAVRRGGDRNRDRARRCAPARARAGGDPPRHQAAERVGVRRRRSRPNPGVACVPGARVRERCSDREADRLRRRAPRRRGVPHPHRRRAGHARLHGPRADRRRRGRRGGRPLLARAGSLRGAQRRQPRARPDACRHGAAHRRAAAAVGAPAQRSAARAHPRARPARSSPIPRCAGRCWS